MAHLSKQKIYPGELESNYLHCLQEAGKINLVSKIINKNPGVFGMHDISGKKLIVNRLGWIDTVRAMPSELARIERLVEEVRADGIRHVFILGMGGSSLSPEVFGRIMGKKSWLKSYTVVDTTAPSRLAEIIAETDFHKAFFLVSSKSGSTIETVAQFRFFFRLMKELRPLKAGAYFAAITDEGSDLHRIARRNRFRATFLNPPDIGGRYSALSFFGLVPAAFTRANLSELLGRASDQLGVMETRGNDCDALRLGTLLGCGAKYGHDKLRLLATESMRPFNAWIEQLVAESTGKEQKGILPVDIPSDGNSGKLTGDLVDVYLSMSGERYRPFPYARDEQAFKIPHVSIEMPDQDTLGAEMFKWEMATAVASVVIGVNPFDEPNVAESKRNTTAILRGKRGPRRIVPVRPVAGFKEVDIVSFANIKGLERRRQITASELLTAFLAGVHKGDYLSVLCYAEMQDEIEAGLRRMQTALELVQEAVVTLGFGPRFLHSTGQLHKGGSQKGHFLVLEREYPEDFDIPGMNLSFGRLIKAQVQGDVKALERRKRPLITCNLKNDPVAGLDRLVTLIRSLQTG